MPIQINYSNKHNLRIFNTILVSVPYYPNHSTDSLPQLRAISLMLPVIFPQVTGLITLGGSVW